MYEFIRPNHRSRTVIKTVLKETFHSENRGEFMTLDEAIEQFKYDAECNRADLDLSYAEDNEQVAEWLEELKALRLLLDWAIECDFGLDSFPEEYEKYKHTLTDDMTYKDMIIQIAKCVVAEEIKERTEK